MPASPGMTAILPLSANCKAESSEVSMPIRTTRSYALQLVFFFLVWTFAGAQAKPNQQIKDQQNKDQQKPASSPRADYSGTNRILRDAEFVQITVEDQDRVTGLASRYGESERHAGGVLGHFF